MSHIYLYITLSPGQYEDLPDELTRGKEGELLEEEGEEEEEVMCFITQGILIPINYTKYCVLVVHPTGVSVVMFLHILRNVQMILRKICI